MPPTRKLNTLYISPATVGLDSYGKASSALVVESVILDSLIGQVPELCVCYCYVILVPLNDGILIFDLTAHSLHKSQQAECQRQVQYQHHQLCISYMS